MTIAYMPRKDANKLVIVQGKTLGALLRDNALGDNFDIVALYNWGTKIHEEVNRALVELVGCSEIDPDPLKSKLDPALGTGGAIYKPLPWQPKLEVEKTHLVKLRKRLPPTAVAITGLTAFFDPAAAGAAEKCSAQCRFDGVLSRAAKRDFEVHAARYYELVKHGAGGSAIEVETPRGVSTKEDLTDTLIFREAQDGGPGSHTFDWLGTSQAAEGVLKTPAKINSHCAPYFILVRHYLDDADKNARILLKPFYPRWKLVGTNTRELIDESMIVNWTCLGSPASLAKLKIGLLEVRDKDNALAFFTALTKDQLDAGSYDLLAGPKKWNRPEIRRAKMPYRVQLQAHSDADEDKGLALATMATQVPAYVHDKVQLIGFNVQNDVAVPNTGAYLGDPDADADIALRCRVLIQAIQTAALSAQTTANVLKVFVAPEFYFRGQAGAYPIEKIQSICGLLSKETDQPKYVDWLFVFGTAIGRLKHEDTAAAGTATIHKDVLHRVRIVSVDEVNKTVIVEATVEPRAGGILRQPAKSTTFKLEAGPALPPLNYKLKVADTAGLVVANADWIEPITVAEVAADGSGFKVSSRLFAKIPLPLGQVAVGGQKWKIRFGAQEREIIEVKEAAGYYELTLALPYLFIQNNSAIELLEPVTAEILNVALVQRGWRAPSLGDQALREILVYKEYISHIDFSRSSADPAAMFYADTGEGRKVWLDGTANYPILPTDGSQDTGGAHPNVSRKPDSAVGSEINASGLGGGCVFTMHGITFGLEVCRDHLNQRLWNFYHAPHKSARAGDPQVQVQLIPSWGMTIGSYGQCVPGSEVTTVPNGLVFNVDGSRMQSVARINDGRMLCDTHTHEAAPQLSPAHPYCWRCAQAVSNPMTCIYHAGAAAVLYNGSYFCPICYRPCVNLKLLQRLGTPLPEPAEVPVPLSNSPLYFKSQGNVQVFQVRDLPPPDVVA